MSRVRFAAEILKPLGPKSLLDVGCRDAELSRYIDCEYHGADLFPGELVSYVGPIDATVIDRTFDVIVACDILEHLDDPSMTFDRLAALAERHVLISLPNCYDLKSRVKFATTGQLGGKYLFTEEPLLDRHRWLMNRNEIHAFARAKASKHGFAMKLFDLTYGRGKSPRALVGRTLSAILPRSLGSETVFALFSRDTRDR